MQPVYVLYATFAVFVTSIALYLLARHMWNGLDARIDDFGTIGFSKTDEANVRGRFSLNQNVIDKSVVRHDTQKSRLVKLEEYFKSDYFVGVN